MKNSLKVAARALLGVEQLERRDVPSVVYWTGDAGTTHWNDAGNWSTVDPLKSNVPSPILPGPTDAVVIDRPGVTVDHSAASQDMIGSLQVTAANVTLKLSAGTLDLSGTGSSGTFQVDQTGDVVSLQGGTLKDATVTSGTTIVAGNTVGTLDGVTLDGTLQDGTRATITNGLILNGSIYVGNSVAPGTLQSSVLTFDDSNGPQALSTTGQGQIHFAQGFGTLEMSGSKLTIGAGITIHGPPVLGSAGYLNGPFDNFGNIDDDLGTDIIVNLQNFQGSSPWSNDGAIEVSKGLLILGSAWTNNGTITASRGATLQLGDTRAGNPPTKAWINNGSINTNGALIYLDGVLTPSPTNYDPAALGLGADTVYLQGTLENSGHTLTLTPGVTSASGNWNVTGQIDGGTVDETSGSLIDFGGATLNDVTLINPPTPSGLVSLPPEIVGPEQPADPLQLMGPNGRYVDLLYERLLGRTADAQGGTNFVIALDNGQTTQLDVVEEILNSQEYLTREVTQLYQKILGRAPDAGGLASSVAMLATGASSTQFEAFLLGSAEYYGAAGGTNAGFFSALYQTVLGRKADAPGVQSFTQELAGGVSRATVAQQLLVSPEGVLPEVQSIYKTVLNRAADSEGISYFGALLLNGGSPEQVILQLATSSEFVGAANGDVGQVFVTQVYQALLGRAPEPAALTSLAGEIDAGTATRLQIIEAIQSSTEYRTDAVDALYQEVLGRAPDPVGLAGSLAFLEQGGTVSQLEAMLLSSDEFLTVKGGGTNSGFLSALYPVALNRAVDSIGAQSFGQALAADVSRTTVVADVLFSPESEMLEVRGLYMRYLGRSVDPGGLSSALARLQSGASLDQIAAILSASPEYLDRL